MNLFEYDKNLNIDLLCGVDEAGRGPLAGPVVASAVILPQGIVIDGLNDSKKITEKKRELLYNEIIEKALSYNIEFVYEKEIDDINILQATFVAMKKSVEGLGITPNLVLIDGNKNPDVGVHSKCIIKGDATSACIAAASILAKVARDRYMLEMDKQYPIYNFAKHKGYGTKLHREILLDKGPCAIHRTSFLGKILGNKSSKKGEKEEKLAQKYLLKKGYEVLDTNYSSKYGEIDIIAKKGDILAFVEVKARKQNNYHNPVDAVNNAKKDKIIKTALEYYCENNISVQPRFDIIEILNLEGNYYIKHIESGFEVGNEYTFI